MSTRELELFKSSLRKANQILNVIGLQTDDEETSQSMMERLKNRKLFFFLFFSLYLEVAGDVAWFFDRGLIKGNFIEATYSLPCATLCFVGSVKTFYRIKYGHYINELIYTLRRLQTVESGIHTEPNAYKAIVNIVESQDMAVKALLIFNLCGLAAFSCSPLFIMAYIYYTSGELAELRFPYTIYYPFDATDLRVYPFIYLHQVISGVVAVFTVFGPDCLHYLFCTFVQVQFCSLQYDLERIIPQNATLRAKEAREEYQKKFLDCVTRHRELIRIMLPLALCPRQFCCATTSKASARACTNISERLQKFGSRSNILNALLYWIRTFTCVALIEVIHCKSALFNICTSSLMICLAGFNIMAYEDLSMLWNFLSFLVMCLLQIYLTCYYGDNVSRSSVEVGYAVYKSQWYNVDAKTAKDLQMTLMRAQKPCKLTAYTFSEINLSAFTRILSTSWSYFALLQSMFKQ